jgi:hypothetical protein
MMAGISTINTIRNIDNNNIMPRMIKADHILYANCMFCHRRIRVKHKFIMKHIQRCIIIKLLPEQLNESVREYIQRKYL